MTMRRVIAIFAAVVACLGLHVMWGGCRHASTGVGEGVSSFQFGPAAVPLEKTQAKVSMGISTSRDVLVDAQPIEPLAKPVYPKIARAAKLGVVTVAVQITIDAEGRVANVTPSLSQLAMPRRFSREFEDAVEAALAQWRFTPSELRHMEEAPGAEGGTYLRLARREKIEAKGEVVFTFNDTGEVWSGLRGK
jgi:hypothetical protein